MLFLNHHSLLRNASCSINSLLQTESRFRLSRLAKAFVLSGSILGATEANAIYVSYVTNRPGEPVIRVDQSNMESKKLPLTIRATAITQGHNTPTREWSEKWNNRISCAVTGETWLGSTIWTGQKHSFSMAITPREVDGKVYIDTVEEEITFDILERDEMVGPVAGYENWRAAWIFGNGQLVCDGEVIDQFTFGGEKSYGYLIFEDPFEGQDPNAPPPVQQHKPIPTRQKSLSSQLNSLRTLTLHSSNTRDRGIAKELNRARTTKGFRADNLQVKANGQSLSVGSLMGAGAGDPLDDFGRWGMFVTGSIDVGDANKNSSDDEGEFDSSQLTVGLDYHLNDHIVVGGAVNLTTMRAGSHSIAKTDFNRSSVSVFGSLYASDAFYLDAIFSYGMSNYDLSRTIDGGDDVVDSASADTDGDESSAFIGAGYNLNSQNVNVRLFTALNYIDANVDGYQESVSGTSSAAKIDRIDLQSFTADFGAELSWNLNTNVGVFTPMMSIAYERQYADDSVYITGSFIGGLDEGSFYHQAPDRDDQYMRGQVGLSGVFKNGFSAFVSYDSYLEREDLSSGMVSLGARWQF